MLVVAPISFFSVLHSERRADKVYGDFPGRDARRPERAALPRRPPGAGNALRPGSRAARALVTRPWAIQVVWSLLNISGGKCLIDFGPFLADSI